MRKGRRASQREIEFTNEMVSPISCGDSDDADDEDDEEEEEEEEPKKDEDEDDEEDDEPIWTATEWEREQAGGEKL